MKANNNEAAPLINIGKLAGAIHEANNRKMHLTSFIVLSGPSGYGKSYAAAYNRTKYDCTYIEADASWGIGTLLDTILEELNHPPVKGVNAKKLKAVTTALVEKGTPLIIDEFDHLVKPKILEIVRAIHDKTYIPVVVIGEELLPQKLDETERFSNRVYTWVQAEPVTIEDARKLNDFYCSEVKIEDDLLQKLVDISQGRVRRVCTNLAKIEEEARQQKWKKVNTKLWGNRRLETGKAPLPRPLARKI